MGHAFAQFIEALHYKLKVADSIPGGVIGFHWHYVSGFTIALGSTQPLMEMSNSRVIPLQARCGPKGG